MGTGLSIQNSCSAFTSQIKSQAATINSADCASLRTEVQSGKYGTPTARCASCQSRRQQQLFYMQPLLLRLLQECKEDETLLPAKIAQIVRGCGLSGAP